MLFNFCDSMGYRGRTDPRARSSLISKSCRFRKFWPRQGVCLHNRRVCIKRRRCIHAASIAKPRLIFDALLPRWWLDLLGNLWLIQGILRYMDVSPIDHRWFLRGAAYSLNHYHWSVHTVRFIAAVQRIFGFPIDNGAQLIECLNPVFRKVN